MSERLHTNKMFVFLLVFAKIYQFFLPRALRASKKKRSFHRKICSQVLVGCAVLSDDEKCTSIFGWDLHLRIIHWLQWRSGKTPAVAEKKAARRTKRIYKHSLELEIFAGMNSCTMTIITREALLTITYSRNGWSDGKFSILLYHFRTTPGAQHHLWISPHRHFSFKINFIRFSRQRVRSRYLWSVHNTWSRFYDEL